MPARLQRRWSISVGKLLQIYVTRSRHAIVTNLTKKPTDPETGCFWRVLIVCIHIFLLMSRFYVSYRAFYANRTLCLSAMCTNVNVMSQLFLVPYINHSTSVQLFVVCWGMYYGYIFVHFNKFYIFYKLKNIYTNSICVLDWIFESRRYTTYNGSLHILY